MLLTKNFSTQTVEGSSCWFRRDYSYRTNPNTCLGCEFCYKYSTGDPERRRSAKYIDTNEKFHSKTIFKTPIIISRFCEPFTDGHSTDASIAVAEKCLENDCQFIFKTGKDIPNKAQILMKSNPDMCQLQLRFVSDYSPAGRIVSKELAPGMVDADLQAAIGKAATYCHIDTVAIFDPFIIGVNDMFCKNLIGRLAESGFKKLIIKQLFATDYFLQYLKLRVDRRFVDIMSVNTSGFWTYNNMALLYYLYPILKECSDHGIIVSICSNRFMNELVYGPSNCCQFENPIGFYNKEGNIING